MSDLRLDLDTIDFEKLAELGRSLIPTHSRTWTDHNTHDPGIMLVELLAWVADAQIYALSRTRQDERLAYANLLGIQPHGPEPARGLIWPSERPPGTPPPWPDGLLVRETNRVVADAPDAPVFHTTHPIRLSAAELAGLHTDFAHGMTRDWLGANREDGATFMPFSEAPTKGDTLVLELTRAGIAPSRGYTSIGFELVGIQPALHRETPASPAPTRLRVSIVDSRGERPVQLAADATLGLLRSGVLLLRGVETSDTDFSLMIRSANPRGAFLRPPRVQRIALNILPVQQLASVVEDEPTFGKALPNQAYELSNLGFVFPVDKKTFRVALSDPNVLRDWTITRDLSACNPDEKKFALEPETRTIHFGNGLNGAIPPFGATLHVEYQASAGTRGNIAKGIQWSVQSVAGVFGHNSEAMSGGADGLNLARLRALARNESLRSRPNVTADDLARAAASFADLGVRRAFEVAPSLQRGRRVRGTRVLVSLGPHDTIPGFVETSDWLNEIHRRLAPSIPVGQRLEVIAPRLIDLRVTARMTAAPNLDPAAVKKASEATLHSQLALVANRKSDSEWPFGRDVTVTDVKGWLRRVEGVAKLDEVRLFADGEEALGKVVRIKPTQLPRLQLGVDDIQVARWSRSAAS